MHQLLAITARLTNLRVVLLVASEERKAGHLRVPRRYSRSIHIIVLCLFEVEVPGGRAKRYTKKLNRYTVPQRGMEPWAEPVQL